ncbi:MAG: Bug family tripartite tricarboxylate transporter substrate binding protein [Lautropia sp.]
MKLSRVGAMRRRTALAAGLTALGCPWAGARAQDKYPNRPITFVIAFPPGSGSDTLARLLASEVSTLLEQPVIVENKPGASNMLAARYVANSKPGNGYMIFLGNNALWMVQPVIDPDCGYAFDDFDHMMMLAETPYVLVARPDRKWTELADLVAEAKRRPGRITFGSTGTGGTLHLVVERLMETTGIRLSHVPYRGPAQAQTDLLGGHIDLMFDSIPSANRAVSAGRLTALAVSTRERLAPMPKVRTVAEQGYPGFSMYGWWSLATPAGTPRPMLDTIQKAFTAALATPSVKAYCQDNALLTVPPTRDYLMSRLQSEGPVYSALIKRLDIKPDKA